MRSLAVLMEAVVVISILADNTAAFSSSLSGPHITDLNVLLPPQTTNPVHYRLIGTGGCFSWSWDHHDILLVQPEYDGSSQCSTSALLMSIAPYSGRKETAIYAADLHSGAVIRCEVFIDKVSRIQIFHHSIKLDLDGLATLHIRAFDDEDNVFSSLVGLQFMWQLMPKPYEADNLTHHLVHVPLKDTPLTDCGGFCGDLDTQIKLENSGVGSDLYVVKGIKIGHEIVTAQLLEPQFEHVLDKIVLTVAEAMSLEPPSPVFVMIGAKIQYRLIIIRYNTPQAIDLPSHHHRWSILNSTVAQVDSTMGSVIALNLGTTSVIVEDTRVSGHMQISTMHVVVPAKLCLYIIPVTVSFDHLEEIRDSASPVWYVVSGQQYVVHVKVFSAEPDGNEIQITENNDLKLEGNTSKYWDTFTVINDVVFPRGWKNSIFLKPHSQGQGTLTSSLTYRRWDLERKEVLKVVQEVIVCNKVKVMGYKDEYLQIIHLPWAPGVYQEVELKATGGCGRTSKDYGWFSADVGTVSIIASGIIRSNRPGRVTIKVVSVFDIHNYDEVIVEVTVPSSMVMLPDLAEAVVGTNIEAAVAFKTSKGDYYYKCDAFSSSVRWKFLSGSEFFKVANSTKKVQAFDILPHLDKSEPLHGRSCARAYLYASGPGHAILHATFSSEMLSSDDSLDGQIILQASAIVGAYTPLVILQAGNGNQFGGYWVDFVSTQDVIRKSVTDSLGELYLVPGTGIDILLVGGPERWNQDVKYIETVEIISEKGLAPADEILVKQAATSGGRLYRVSCQSVGNFKLVFSRGNLAGDDHPLPVVASVGLSVICSFPSTITLIANERANTHVVIKSSMKADRGLGKIRTSPVIVANGCTIRLAAVGIHISGRPFANSSSLCLRWQLSGCEDLAHWNGNNTTERSRTTWERFLVLHNASGMCTVRATVIGFLESMASSRLKEAYLQLESVETALTDALRLQLVSSLRIVPEYSLLVFHPEAKVNISITGGTCFLEAVMNDTQVAEIIKPPNSAQCSWMILGAKGLGTATIAVYDIGLSPPASVSGLLTVADVDWIKIIAQEEISLMQGTMKALDLLAGTQDGNVFDSCQFAYMDIHVHYEDGILKLVSNDGASNIGDSRVFGPTLLIRAEKLGLATLYVSARKQSGVEIPSQVIKVEVFAPLRIHPDYVFLVPGASYMVGVKGGPTIGVVVEYFSKDDEIATVDRSLGRLSAVSIGNTTVRAAVHENGQTLICEAYARVEVRIPSVMILNLQSRQLCVGCQMPIFPSCVEGDLFSFYEVCKDYSWSVEDEKVLSFQTPKSVYYPDVYEVPASSGIKKNYDSDSNDKDHGFINIISGRSGGKTKVSVSFSCDFVSSGSRQPVSYNASESLIVVSELPLALGVPITWVLPPFYTTSEVLPGSAESYGQSYSHQSKRTIVYSLLKTCENTLARPDPIVIAGTKIKTRESNNIACIQAKEQTGRTGIASCVRVAEVAQVRLTAKDFLSHVVYLSVNDRIELNVGYCDDLGYPFFQAHGAVSLDAETNYHDIIAIHLPTGDKSRNDSRGIIHLQARSQGSALVKIFINHDGRKAVYILVSVGAQIFPRNPVINAGKFLNFSLIGDGMRDELPGRWLSTNETVIFIDGFSGEAQALNEGVTAVFFDGSNLKLQTNVTVLKVDLILVNAPEETLTNVPFPAKGYKFSVSFSDPQDATGTSIKAPYVCRVDPPFVGYAKPWTDHITDTSYCLFFPYSPKHLASSISKSKTTREQLKSSGNEGFMHISIIASLRDAQDVMGSTHALFVGGFSVSETDKLNLTQNSNKTRIKLSGNTDVEIQWSARDKLMIRPLQKDDLGIGGSVEFEVEIVSGRSFTDRIIIMLPVTGQTSELHVSYNNAETSTSTRSRGFIWVAVLMCTVLLISTIIVFLRFLDRPSSTRPSEQSSPPSTAVLGPVTPDRTQSSPRTPQPFLEYVRRTVDETPYYKRQGRRRFDPQYTY